MTTRIGGIQSGLDTESLITTILDAERQPIVRQEEKIQELQTDVYGWQTLDSALADLSSVTGQLSAYTTWAQKSGISSSTDQLTASAEREAITGSYTITTNNLAVSHSIKADSIEQTDLGVANADTALGKEGSFRINGQEITYEADDTLREIAEKINVASASIGNNATSNEFRAVIIDKTLVLESSQSGTGNELLVGETSGTLLKDLNIISGTADDVTLTSTTSSQVAAFADTRTSLGLTGKFSVNGNEVSINTTHSLEDIVQKINDFGGEAEITSDERIKLTFGAYTDTEGLLADLGFSQQSASNELEIPTDTIGFGISDFNVENTTTALGISGVFGIKSDTPDSLKPVTIQDTDSLEDIRDKFSGVDGITATITDDNKLQLSGSGIVITDDVRHIVEKLGFSVEGKTLDNIIADIPVSFNENSELGLTGSFEIGGETINLSEADTLTTIAQKIDNLTTHSASINSGEIEITAGDLTSISDSYGLLEHLGFTYDPSTNGAQLSKPKPTSIAVGDLADENTVLGLEGSFTLSGNVINVALTDTLEDIRAAIDDFGDGTPYDAVITDDKKLVITSGDLSSVADTNNILSDLGFNVQSDYTAEFDLDSNARSAQIADLGLGVTTSTEDLNLTGDFKIDGKEITLSGDETLEDIKDLINNASSKVTASVSADGELLLSTSEDGITVDDGTGDILQRLGLTSSSKALHELNTVVTKSSVMDFDLTPNGSSEYEFTLTADGNTTTVTLTTDLLSLEAIQTAINSATRDSDPGEKDFSATIENGELVIDTAAGGDLISYTDKEDSDLLQKLGLMSTSASTSLLGVADKDTTLGMSGRINVGGTLIEMDADGDDSSKISTLSELSDAINNVAGYSARVTSDNQLIIDSGDLSKINDTNGILQAIGVFDTFTTANETIAEDLEATVNGVEVTASDNDGVDSILEGVNLSFKEEGVTTTLKVNNNTDALKDLIKQFIEKYNETMELMEALGKVELTESEDELSAVGILQGEFLISDIQIQSRTTITQSNAAFFGDTLNSLDDIGIWTETRDNRLSIIDEAALDNALENHFDELEDLFRDVEYDDKGEITNQGLMRDFDNYVQDLIQPLTGRLSMRTKSIEDDISSRQEYIARKTSDLETYEAYLWQNFANMESAVSGIQNGAQYMLQNLGL